MNTQLLTKIEEIEGIVSQRPLWHNIDNMVVLEAWSEFISTAKNLVKWDQPTDRIEQSLQSALDCLNAYQHSQDTERKAYVGLWALTDYIQGGCPVQSKKAAHARYRALV